jgi:lysophospholipase L1-like esterase
MLRSSERATERVRREAGEHQGMTGLRAEGWLSSSVRGPLGSLLAILGLAACGGGGGRPSNPTGSSSPPPPTSLHSVTGSVFYDVNRNNVVDAGETFRLGDVVLQIGSSSARTEPATGRAVVQGVPAGSQPISVQLSSLPPFFVPGAPLTIEVPRSDEVSVPVALPIGRNIPFRYLASGDSISQGTGSSNDTGFRNILQSRLGRHYGATISMFYRGGGGGTSDDATVRIARDLELLEPAYTLIGWGTNDWNGCGAPASCRTVSNLRSVVRAVKTAGSLPCVATILPPNVGYDSLAPASRLQWTVEMNGLIVAMAREEGALVADLHAAYMRSGPSGLFVDHVHPNSRGYEVIADAWFDALTRPRSVSGQ